MNREFFRHLFPLAMGLLMSVTCQSSRAADPLVFVSSFAAGENGAIRAFQLDLKTGELTLLYRTTGVQNPFFITVSPDHKFLYSIHAEKFGGKDPEQVAAYELKGRTGELKLLNRQSTHGTASCYLDVDHTGKMVLVGNYSSGNVASLPVHPDGSLGPAVSVVQNSGKVVDPVRQKEPHAHCFVVSPDNKYGYAADLGLDRIFGFTLDPAKATLTPNRQQFARTPPRAGPRHLTFHPKLPYMYVINEIENSVTVFDYHADSGTLIEQQTISTLPADYHGTSNCADLKITPDGRFLYGTNRGHDSIASYEIGHDGRLKLLSIDPSLGKGPQNLAITSGGELLLCANLPESNLVVFQIDSKTGKLRATGDPLSITSPSCIVIR